MPDVSDLLHEDHPQPGYYWLRFRRLGPRVPVHIYWSLSPRETCEDCGGRGFLLLGHDGRGSTFYDPCSECRGLGKVPTADDVLVCRIQDGIEADPYKMWPYCCGNPIDSREFLAMVRRYREARSDPEMPEARPGEDIDLDRLPPIGP